MTDPPIDEPEADSAPAPTSTGPWVPDPQATGPSPIEHWGSIPFLDLDRFAGHRVGPFEIEALLGKGAMGAVYRARFHRSGEGVIPVAMKLIAPNLLHSETAMTRFEREVNIRKQLKHPHIVRIVAYGKIYQRVPYIAMELIDGESLDRVLAR
jgi:serine/threonine protein kinase